METIIKFDRQETLELIADIENNLLTGLAKKLKLNYKTIAVENYKSTTWSGKAKKVFIIKDNNEPFEYLGTFQVTR